MIVVDASVWASVLMPDDMHHDSSMEWQEWWIRAHRGLIAPAVFLPEVSGALARRTNDAGIARQAVVDILNEPLFDLVTLDIDLADQAAQLAVDLRLRGADACYVAVAKRLGLRLLTWDDEMRSRAAGVVEVITPAELQRDTR